MNFKKKPVKVWQVLLIAGIIVVLFFILALRQSQYNVTPADKPFSAEALASVGKIAGSTDDLYATAFTYNDSETETFVISLSAPGQNGRRQNWNLICYQKDGQMPYRMEKGETAFSLEEGAQLLDQLFPRLELFREQKNAVFGLFDGEAKAAEDETGVQLDVRGRFGETDLLTQRKTEYDESETSEEGETDENTAPPEPMETRIPLTQPQAGLVTITVTEGSVTKKPYEPGDCTETSLTLYRSGTLDNVRTETLLAVVNVEDN